MSRQLLCSVNDTNLFYEVVPFGDMEIPVLHLSLEEWSHNWYKQYLSVFYKGLRLLKEQGFDAVYVIIPNDPKLVKFEEMFGFEELDVIENCVIMSQELI